MDKEKAKLCLLNYGWPLHGVKTEEEPSSGRQATLLRWPLNEGALLRTVPLFATVHTFCRSRMVGFLKNVAF